MESRVPGRLTSNAGFAALVLVLCLLTASCTSASPASGSAPQVSRGTLRVGVLTDALTENSYSSCVFTFCGATGDPQFNASSQSMLFELDRCCLMNLAMPPLDDVHVRRTINFAIPRQPLLRLWDKAHRTGSGQHTSPLMIRITTCS